MVDYHRRALVCLFFFFLRIRRPPRSTLFPSTPLFRSDRLDVVAVLVHPRRLAAQPQHRLEEPLAVRVLHRIFPGHRKFAAAGVAVFALGAPAAFPEKESVVYPCTFTLSAGAPRRPSMG